MRRIVKLSLILLMTVFIMGNVYAALSCQMEVKASKTEVSKNEEFTVDVNISNIQSDKGVISLGGTLEYDKDSLELVRMEGKNGWETPIDGVSFNKDNGKIAITRNGLGKNNETVFTIKFKVKEGSKKNLTVTLKDITVADGTSPAKISVADTKITVKDGAQNPVSEPDNKNTNTNTQNKTNNTNIVANNLNKTATTNNPLPKTGGALATGFILIVFLGVLVAGGFFRKIKFIDKEIERETKRENK